MTIGQVVRLARPRHWIKNGIVLFPIVFGQRVTDVDAWVQTGLALVSFCLAASAAYVLNDIADRESDRKHPQKKDRPLASGEVGVPAALVLAVLFLVAAVAVSLLAGLLVSAIVVAYLVLQLAYSRYLKRKMLADVVCISLGFVLRAVAGAVAIQVEVSPWLVVCTFTLCLFLGFCKRRGEIAAFPDPETAKGYRHTLIGYTPELLNHLTTLSAGIAIVSYLLYASSPRTINNFGTAYQMYTLPVVIYAICRFAMLSMTRA